MPICHDCKHLHADATLAGICIGCPCPRTDTDWLRVAVPEVDERFTAPWREGDRFVFTDGRTMISGPADGSPIAVAPDQHARVAPMLGTPAVPLATVDRIALLAWLARPAQRVGCGDCKGAGGRECHYCRGTGQRSHKCGAPGCDHTCATPCDSCDGGKRKCPTCGGEGSCASDGSEYLPSRIGTHSMDRRRVFNAVRALDGDAIAVGEHGPEPEAPMVFAGATRTVIVMPMREGEAVDALDFASVAAPVDTRANVR